MAGISFDDLMKKLPKEVQEAAKRESTRLSAECFLMHDEDVAKDFIKHLSKSRQEEIMREAAKLKAQRQAQLAKKQSKAASAVATPTNTSDSLASPPVPLSTKSK